MENAQQHKNKIVAYWLLVGVGMIMVQVLLGGITRLTGSGLSITDWKPIMGFIPPLNEADWQIAFEKYKQIPQYTYINSHFTLSDFKFIFFWEWFHRLWARSLGLVFAIPFIYFIIKRYLNKNMIIPFVILFILGGIQGLIGWIMVSSGLAQSNNLYVNHIKLAIHFIAALLLLCYTLWFALQLLIPETERIKHNKSAQLIIITIGILTLQLTYGAFMAGLKTALYAPTWPTINGAWLPNTLSKESWINHPINIHFIHRTLAYILLALIIYLSIRLKKTISIYQLNLSKKNTLLLPLLVAAQVILGICTVLFAPKTVLGHFGIFETFALLHQLIAMALLIVLIIELFFFVAPKETQQA